MYRGLLASARRLSISPQLQALKLLQDVKSDPNNIDAVCTSYGWFLVPKKYVSRGWTESQLDQLLLKIPGLKLGETISSEDSIFEKAQEEIEKWVEQTKKSDIPNPEIETALTRKKAAEQALYITQYLGNSLQRKDGAMVESRPKEERVSFTHAWNYFRSICGNEFRKEDGKIDQQAIVLKWKSMSKIEKNEYREAYMKVLQEGKEVFMGKIVTREFKDEWLKKRKASVGRGRPRKKDLKELSD